MSAMRGLIVAAALLAAAGLAVPAEPGGATARHSGAIASLDLASSTLVLAEIGPWQVKDGQTVLTTTRIGLLPSTVYVRAVRADDAPSGFAGDFVERAMTAGDLRPGDVITADCEQAGRRLVARKVTFTLTAP
jgi:hypothetical protein